MTDLSDSDKNGSSDAAATETIEIKIDPNSPKSITMITGEYPQHGYKGTVEVECTWEKNVFTIRALRYLFGGTAVIGSNSRFEIARDNGGPILLINPVQNGGWRNWDSSTNYQTLDTALDFNFYFVFNAPPEGLWQTARRRVLLKI